MSLLSSIVLQAIVFPVAAADGELVFGVYPYLSPSQTVTQFTPLADYLAQALGRPVSLRSAPDFASFVARTRAGEYDIIFTAPHMGRLAERRDGYRPLARSGYSIVIVALTRDDSPIRTLADLRGRTLGIGARLSMTYQIMQQALAREGLVLERDVFLVTTASFSNVLAALQRKEIDAGATGSLLWNGTPEQKRRTLREIYRSSPVPGFLLLGHARLGAATLGRLAQALYDFAATPAGQRYFAASQQIDFRPVDAAIMQRIDPFTAIFDQP